MTMRLAIVALSGGAISIAIAFALRAWEREDAVSALLRVTGGRSDAELARAAADHGVVVTGTLDVADRVLARTGVRQLLRARLDRADVGLRDTEFVVLVAVAAAVIGAVSSVVLGSWWVLPATVAAAAPIATGVLGAMARRRTRRFAEQFPDALTMVASSLTAGHTLLRALQALADDVERPLADELQWLLREHQLGASLVESLERMADRIGHRDVAWVVQAVRIQQEVGGQLSELMVTLAEVMRSRQELRREVRVLTAEGRISAWVLGFLPFALGVAVHLTNPGYLAPMLRGWGIVVLGLTGASVAIGVWVILRMVQGVER